jgi:hypothetical protein
MAGTIDRAILLRPDEVLNRITNPAILDGLLGRESPAFEVFSHAAHMQFDAVFLFDELTYGSKPPKKKSILSCSGRLSMMARWMWPS